MSCNAQISRPAETNSGGVWISVIQIYDEVLTDLGWMDGYLLIFHMHNMIPFISGAMCVAIADHFDCLSHFDNVLWFSSESSRRTPVRVL